MHVQRQKARPWTRHRKALDIPEGIGLRGPGTDDSETLALGGAVFQRMWEYDGQLEHLHEALVPHRAAYERNPARDMGYGRVNAAYILDLLASRVRAAAGRGVEVSAGTLVVAVGVAALGSVFPLWKMVSPKEAKWSVAVKLGTATFGYLAAKVHLWLFHRCFLKQGTLKRLLEKNP